MVLPDFLAICGAHLSHSGEDRCLGSLDRARLVQTDAEA